MQTSDYVLGVDLALPLAGTDTTDSPMPMADLLVAGYYTVLSVGLNQEVYCKSGELVLCKGGAGFNHSTPKQESVQKCFGIRIGLLIAYLKPK